MKVVTIGFVAVLAAFAQCRAEDAMLLKSKMELLVEQAGELLADSNRKGSDTHTPPYRYYYGLMYGCGTNLLARKESPVNTGLMRKYIDLIEKNYEAYTKVETAGDVAAATGNGKGKAGGRHRAKRIASTERLGEKELAAAIKQWETFVQKLKRIR